MKKRTDLGDQEELDRPLAIGRAVLAVRVHRVGRGLLAVQAGREVLVVQAADFLQTVRAALVARAGLGVLGVRAGRAVLRGMVGTAAEFREGCIQK